MKFSGDDSSVCAHCKNNFYWMRMIARPACICGKIVIPSLTAGTRMRTGLSAGMTDDLSIYKSPQTLQSKSKLWNSIRESEERYRNLFDSVPVGIYHSTPDGRFLDGNTALLEILGYPDQETMMAANIKDLYLDESVREQELATIEQGDFIDNYRVQLRRSDGAVIWVQDSANAVRDSSGGIVHYYGRLRRHYRAGEGRRRSPCLSGAVQDIL